jgi:hypothetical protein
MIMNPRNPCFLTAMLLLFCVTGCGHYHFLTPPPHTHGTWTGEIVSLTVYDHYGREYPAAALAITSGPSIPNIPIPEACGSGNLPLLAVKSDSGHQIRSADESLIGQDVKVSGTMYWSHVLANTSDGTGLTLSRLVKDGKRSSYDHSIVVEKRLKPLNGNRRP